MPEVLHILPHAGGGGEKVVEMLEGIDEGYAHRRFELTSNRQPLVAAPLIATRFPALVAAMRSADLVHVIGDMAALLSLPLLRTRPAVLGTHGLHLLRRAGRVRAPVVRRGLAAAVRRARLTVCSSVAERDELAAIVDARMHERLIVVDNAVPPRAPVGADERRRVREELAIDEDAVVGLFLGQLESRKDPLTAISATEVAVRAGAPVVLLVAGDGPLRAEVDRRAGSAIRVLGHRDDPERLLAAADFLTLPSRREGLPLAVLEAMAAGLPCVVSTEPGTRDAVGDAGIAVEPGDVSGFAEAFANLARDADLRARLGERAAARAAERFGVDRYRRNMRAAFERALA